jgi:adenosine deaminase
LVVVGKFAGGRLLFNTSLVDEYWLLTETFGQDHAGLARIARNAFLSSAADNALKERLLTEFDGWVADNLTSAAGDDSLERSAHAPSTCSGTRGSRQTGNGDF